MKEDKIPKKSSKKYKQKRKKNGFKNQKIKRYGADEFLFSETKSFNPRFFSTQRNNSNNKTGKMKKKGISVFSTFPFLYFFFPRIPSLYFCSARLCLVFRLHEERYIAKENRNEDRLYGVVSRKVKY